MMNVLEKYYKMTGQDFSDIMEGASTFGAEFIENELVPKAISENKKIVWITQLVNGEDLGIVRYELQEI